MIKVKNISEYINSIAPYSTECDWDNCGILVGNPDKTVNKIAFTLDLTRETLTASKQFGADLIITHHPVIFKPQSTFLSGTLAYDLVLNDISVISAHTCFDCAMGGVNDVLCEMLDIENVTGVPSDDCVVPMARIGDIDPVASDKFIEKVAEKLNTVCRVSDSEKTVSKVAVCGGAGMDFFEAAVKLGADAYVTGDASHHHFLEAASKGVTLIAAGHFETEAPAMVRLLDVVSNKFSDTECMLINQSNPVKYIG